MFEGWNYSQVFRVIGQSLEERGVGDFSLAWQDDEFVVRGKRVAQVEQRWLDKFLGQKNAQVERNVEIHYNLKSLLWLQIRGEAMRRDPNQIPDYFRLSQTLRTVGSYIESRAMPILSLRRSGGNLFLELQERSGNKRVEEHGMGSFENYFLRTYLRWRKDRLHQS
jgi:hypothetical protein